MTHVQAKTGTNTKQLTALALLASITLLMAMTPLGFLQTAGLSISLLPVPLGIAAMILGYKGAVAIGAIFGLTSLYQAVMGISVFSGTLFQLNALGYVMTSVGGRVLAGFLTAVCFRWVHARLKHPTMAYFIGGLLAPLFNTICFMSALLLFYWNTDFIQGLNEGLGGQNPFVFVLLFVGINGALEMGVSCIAGGTVASTVKKVFGERFA